MSYPIRSTEDIEGGRWLLRVSYLYRALTQRKNDTGRRVLEAVDIGEEPTELNISRTIREIFENVTEIESVGSQQMRRSSRED